MNNLLLYIKTIPLRIKCTVLLETNIKVFL